MDILTTIQGLLPYAEENTINYFIEQATQDFLNLANITEVPTEANYIVVQMVLIYINKFGNEGISNYSTSGVKYTFAQTLPVELLSQIGNFTCITW